jgi:hypothetical protein
MLRLLDTALRIVSRTPAERHAAVLLQVADVEEAALAKVANVADRNALMQVAKGVRARAAAVSGGPGSLEGLGLSHR